MIDHTLLRADATEADFRAHCDAARELGVGTICVSPWAVPLALELLAGTGITVGSVVGFPFGHEAAAEKAAETRVLRAAGAREFDMVLNVGALRSGLDALVRDDVRAVVDAAEGQVVKVILEICYLTDAEMVRGCALIEEAGAHFVKTSTGFAGGGATLERVALMRRVVGDRVGVKAAGGIRDRDTALAMIGAGANRIGTSSAAAILTGAAASTGTY
jgi:deoxyribose-phosphate aldolase